MSTLGEKPYFDAIRAGDTAALGALLDRDPKLLRATTAPAYDPERPLGCTALHDSIELDQPRITELLIERGAYVDLCSAAILGKIERGRELLDEDPALADDRSTGLTPLGWASFGNRAEVAAELLDRGARRDDDELHCAASVGHVEVGELLIERGADPAALGRNGANALHVAAAMKYTHDSSRFVRMLLGRGVDPAARTADGRTALEIAEAKEREQRAAGDGVRRKYAEVAALLRNALDGRA